MEMEELKRVERQVTEIDKQIVQVDRKVSNIIYLLQGHELDKADSGLVGELNDHAKRLTKLEKLKDKGFWFFIGISIPAGWGIIDILRNLVIK